jgi:hypothetical protein
VTSRQLKGKKEASHYAVAVVGGYNFSHSRARDCKTQLAGPLPPLLGVSTIRGEVCQMGVVGQEEIGCDIDSKQKQFRCMLLLCLIEKSSKTTVP